MQTVHRKLKMAFYGSLLAAVIFGLLFVRNALIGDYFWSLIFLGSMFSGFSTAANPGIFFLNVSSPLPQQSTHGAQRYCNYLSLICYAGALIVWMTGRL